MKLSEVTTRSDLKYWISRATRFLRGGSLGDGVEVHQRAYPGGAQFVVLWSPEGYIDLYHDTGNGIQETIAQIAEQIPDRILERDHGYSFPDPEPEMDYATNEIWNMLQAEAETLYLELQEIREELIREEADDQEARDRIRAWLDDKIQDDPWVLNRMAQIAFSSCDFHALVSTLLA